ncbi:hypothetical protein ACN42_g11493 [Penicillium freii]|uniref:Uncharacterized protein n=1 Tax=Penicillium freii TaxID=48697 RepID=A0A124GPQ9_PENFR|nr:hypothetical protein ACN42_g11493 [Penicillium freii]
MQYFSTFGLAQIGDLVKNGYKCTYVSTGAHQQPVVLLVGLARLLSFQFYSVIKKRQEVSTKTEGERSRVPGIIWYICIWMNQVTKGIQYNY